MITRIARVTAAALPLALAVGQHPAEAVHMGNGAKVGDVRSDRCALWVRLTAVAAADPDALRFPQRKAHTPQLPAGAALHQMAGAMPGADGEVRVRYWLADDQGAARETAWTPVDAATNHAHTFTLKGLKRGARYRFVAQGRRGGASKDDAVDCEVAGAVQLPPPPTSKATASFCVLACQDYHRRDDDAQGHKIYAHMLALQPDFAAHCGDTIYYDKPKPWADTVALARFKWNRFYGLPLQRDFHSQVGTYFVKDDHDTLKNDCWPGQRYGEINWEQGLSLYREQLPLLPGLPYRNVRWGALLEVWFLEGREFRSPNRMPDGPDKTILGKEQWRWLAQTLAASDATFKVVVSATPIVGPDRQSKNDNHANAGFRDEGDRLRRLLATHGAHVVCGDRHWQYASHDPVTGLREWCCGSATNEHAGGFSMRQRTDQHDYLRIRGGFLHVTAKPIDGSAQLILRHVDTDGAVQHEDIIQPSAKK
ncbi:MAG: alkaline phosphatase D family protein [Planctomycetota bacterium]|nr:alkaline phosphatase D family protein [Planctomycetota bacterium]